MTEKEHIEQLEAKVQELQVEAAGGRDLTALARAEKSVTTFDIKIAKIVVDALGIDTNTEQRNDIKNALVNERYVAELSKIKAEEWA